MPEGLLRFPCKKIRAVVIKEYVEAAGYPGVVVFTCGNAANALREVGLQVVEVGPKGDLKTDEWWSPALIHKVWPHLFDATSGHLPIPMMMDISRMFKRYLNAFCDGMKGYRYRVPTGSGETIMCLRWAYPDKAFEPVYNLDESTQFNEEAPLNKLVAIE